MCKWPQSLPPTATIALYHNLLGVCQAVAQFICAICARFVQLVQFRFQYGQTRICHHIKESGAAAETFKHQQRNPAQHFCTFKHLPANPAAKKELTKLTKLFIMKPTLSSAVAYVEIGPVRFA